MTSKFKTLFPMFSLIKKRSLMPLSYLISGGHTFNTKIGKFIIELVRKIERKFFDKHFGIFDILCIEKI